MNKIASLAACITLAMVATQATVPGADAQTFSNSYLDGGMWSTVYAQGFSPSVQPDPDPGLADGDEVLLNQFQFFKSGNVDAAADIQLAILNNIFVDMSGGLSTASGAFVGISTNTIADTTGIATNDPITFDFDNLPLTYGSDYAAVFVNVGGGGELTPVLVSALTANYIDDGTGTNTFVPETNYGADDEFVYAVSNFINGGFFSTFDFAGDANFVASYGAIPEPGTLALVGSCGLLILMRRRRRATA